jgi:hypothetical protein
MRWLGRSTAVLVLAACTQTVAGSPTPASAPNAQPASDAPASRATPDDQASQPAAEPIIGRSKAELLRDTDFRIAFDDVRRLRIGTEFEEIKFGLLRLTLGPGFATVSSARYNLERLYTTYRLASYRNEDTVIELWQDRSKIGEVTAAGVLIGSDLTRPR